MKMVMIIQSGKEKLDDVANYRRGSFPQPYGNKEWYDEKMVSHLYK